MYTSQMRMTARENSLSILQIISRLPLHKQGKITADNALVLTIFLQGITSEKSKKKASVCLVRLHPPISKCGGLNKGTA